MMALVASLLLSLSPAQCQDLTIEHPVFEPAPNGTAPQITVRTEAVEGVQSAIVGQYLVVELEGSDQVSVFIDDATIIGASVCSDGTVVLTRAEPEPEVETVDLVEVYPEHIRPLAVALQRLPE